MSDILTLLDRAHADVSAGKLESALASMLSAWTQVRAPALGDATERLSNLIASSRPPLRGATLVEQDADWHERVVEPAELGVLLERVVDIDAPRACERLQWLAELAPDPRLATRMVELVLRPPFSHRGSLEFWRALFQLLGACADPRALARLEHAGRWYASVTSSLWANLKGYGEHTLASIRAQLESLPVELDPAAGGRLALLAAAIEERATPTSTTDEELLAAIHADPDNVARRSVYADYLQTIGDPRGEFIALQLNDARGALDSSGRRRMRELLAEYGSGWLGEVGRRLVRRSVVFERGFLARAAIKQRSADLAELADDPVWATVESLDNAPLDLLRSPTLRSLRAIRSTPELLDTLLAGEVTLARVERLCVRVEARSHSFVTRRTAPEPERLLARLPALRELVVDTDGQLSFDQLAWVWSSPLAQRLRALELRGTTHGLPAIAELVRELRNADAPLEHVTVTVDQQLTWRMIRGGADGGARWTEVELHIDRSRLSVSDELDALAALGGVELALSGQGGANIEAVATGAYDEAMRELGAALATGDAQAVAGHAHALAGSVMSFARACELAVALRTLGLDGDLSGGTATHDALARELARARQTLARMRAG